MEHEIIGYCASSFYIISVMPEIYYTFKKKGNDISVFFLITQIIATTLFLIYEILINTIPLIIADSFILSELCLLFYLKLIYKRKGKFIENEKIFSQDIIITLV